MFANVIRLFNAKCEYVFKEGNLGIAKSNVIEVAEISVTGVKLLPFEEKGFFDFENGLAGLSRWLTFSLQ